MTYHWLHNMEAMGHVDTTVTADTSTYAVFNKAGTRTYVAYNPGAKPTQVAFSDGTRLDVPPRKLAHSQSKAPAAKKGAGK